MNIKRLILFFTSIFFLSGANFETAAGERTALRIGHDYGPAADVMEFVDAWAYLQKHESTKSVTAALDLPSSKPFGLTSSQFATHKMAWRRSMLAANNNMPSATLTSDGEAPIGTATPGSKAWEAAEAGSQPSVNSVSGLISSSAACRVSPTSTVSPNAVGNSARKWSSPSWKGRISTVRWSDRSRAPSRQPCAAG